MFSRIASASTAFLSRQATKFSRPVYGLSRFARQSYRAYSTGSASGKITLWINNSLASYFQYGFAVAAGLGCGAAVLYGNRLFAVEASVYCTP